MFIVSSRSKKLLRLLWLLVAIGDRRMHAYIQWHTILRGLNPFGHFLHSLASIYYTHIHTIIEIIMSVRQFTNGLSNTQQKVHSSACWKSDFVWLLFCRGNKLWDIVRFNEFVQSFRISAKFSCWIQCPLGRKPVFIVQCKGGCGLINSSSYIQNADCQDVRFELLIKIIIWRIMRLCYKFTSYVQNVWTNV